MKALLIALGISVLGAVIWALTTPLCSNSHGRSNERNASASLKTVATAEADFRSNDRDRNGKEDFWRADVAGLYTTVPKGGGEPDAIKLIELSIAAADDRPVTDIAKYFRRGPKAGYWFRAIRHADELIPDPKRFAFCAFPDAPSAGRWTYIIDEENRVYKADLGRVRGLEVFPDEKELRRDWGLLALPKKGVLPK